MYPNSYSYGELPQMKEPSKLKSLEQLAYTDRTERYPLEVRRAIIHNRAYSQDRGAATRRCANRAVWFSTPARRDNIRKIWLKNAMRILLNMRRAA